MSKPRTPRTATAMPPISRPSSQSTIRQLPSSRHHRRPSDTMHWLSRSPPYSPSKPLRIPEPKLVRSVDALPSRNALLGAGATIVRTPDEALRETGVRLTSVLPEKEDFPLDKPGSLTRASSQSSTSTRVEESISPPTSPPLPPLPPLPLDPGEVNAKFVNQEAESFDGHKLPPARPTRTPPSAPPSRSSSRSSLKGKSHSIVVDDVPIVPPLPPHIAASTQPPPFSAVLISELPSAAMDSSKVIVTLETCTATYRTTLRTINSRPSHLSNYLSSLTLQSDTNSTSSVYSNQSDHLALYRHHLTSQGLIPQSGSIHLFLDRASAPYAHILSYLRSSVVSGQPEALPRELQFHAPPHTGTRIEALVEVRDEAAFLGLDGLHKLCIDEIRLRYGPRQHTRSSSSASNHVQSLHASVYSLHTLQERGETDLRDSVASPTTTESTNMATSKPGPVYVSQQPAPRSLPAPQSWQGPPDQGAQLTTNLKSPPAGWI